MRIRSLFFVSFFSLIAVIELLYLPQPVTAQGTGSISGVVTDGANPITTANVCVLTYDGSIGYGCVNVSVVDGTYTFSNLPVGTYRLNAEAQGYAAEFYALPDGVYNFDEGAAIEVFDAADTPNINFALEPGGTISGNVSDGTNPIVDVTVCAENYNTGWGYACVNPDPITGDYTLVDLVPVDVRVRADAPLYPQKYWDSYWHYLATPVTVTPGTPVTGIDFVLEPGGSISGTVTDGAVGIVDTTVCVNYYDSYDGFGCYSTDPITGAYTITELPPGDYRISVDAPGYVQEFYDNTYAYDLATRVTVTTGADTPGIDVVLEVGGSISGVVMDIDEVMTLPDAWVCVERYLGGWGYGCMQVGSNGEYLFAELPADTYRVEAYAPDRERELYFDTPYYNVANAVEVKVNETTPNINFTLGPGGSIQGTISTGSLPLPNNLGICINDFDTGQHIRCRGNDVIDIATGNFSFDNLPSGSYAVEINVSGYIKEWYPGVYTSDQMQGVEVFAPLDTTGINFSLEPAGAISGTVTDGTNPIPNAEVCVSGYNTSGWYGCVTTDVNGDYLHNTLPAGDFRVESRAPGYAWEIYDSSYFFDDVTPVNVTIGATQTGINFALETAGSISGTINVSDGVPPTNVNVCVNDFTTNKHVRCRGEIFQPGPNTYTVTNLPGGSYRVNVYARHHLNEFYPDTYDGNLALPVTVTAGFDTPDINFMLDPAGAISGVVRDAITNEPLANIPVDLEHGGYGRCTNALGQYTLEGLPLNQPLIVEAGGPGWDNCPGDLHMGQYWNNAATSEEADPITLEPGVGQFESNIDFNLSEGGGVAGKVTDGTNPLSGASVCLQEAPWGQGFGCRNTDTNGDYSFGGLPDNLVYRIDINKDGYAKELYDNKPYYGDHAQATQISVTAGIYTPLNDIVLSPGGTITGTIYNANGSAPLANVPVDLYWGGYGTCTDNNGNFTMTGLPLDTELHLFAGGYKPWMGCSNGDYIQEWWESVEDEDMNDMEGFTLTLAEPDKILSLNLTLGGSISGNVTDGTNGIPFVNICVQVHVWGQGYGCIQTDENGVFLFKGLPTGNYRLDLDKAGYAREIFDNKPYYGDHSQATAIPVSAGDATILENIVLDPGGSISGFVYNTLGQPQGGVPVGLWWGGNDRCTNADGSFTIDQLPLNTPITLYAGGSARPWMGCDNGAFVQEWWNFTPDVIPFESDPITLLPGDPDQDGFIFNLEVGGTVSGTVRDSFGNPLPNVAVHAGYGDPWNGPSTCTNLDGTYTLTAITFGQEFYLTAGYSGECGNNHGFANQWWENSPDNGGVTPLTVTAEIPDLTGKDFALVQGGTVSGTITDSEGNPIVNMGVMVEAAWNGTCTDQAGNYTLYNVYPMEVSIQASGVNFCDFQQTGFEYYPQWKTVLVTSGGSFDIDFVLYPPPAAVTDFTAVVVSDSQIDLNWVDNATDETAYKIWRAVNGVWPENAPPLVELPAGTTTYTDTDVTCGNQYEYSLVAYRDVDQGYSQGINVTANTSMCTPMVLLLPENDAVTRVRQPVFTWEPVTGADRYRIHIDDQIDFSSPLIGNPTATSFTPAEPLAVGTYFWRVRVQMAGTGDWSTWSEIRTFTIDRTKPEKPVHTLPEDGVTLNANTTFTWSAVTDVVQYKIQIDNNTDFSSPEVNAAVTDPQFTPDPILNDGLYYWRVNAFDEADNASGWTTPWSVRFDAVPAQSTTLLTPADLSATRSRTPLFSWEAVAGRKTYQLQISTAVDFTTLLVNLKPKVNTFTPTTALPVTTIYWRVRVQAGDGLWSDWSPVFSFLIDRTAPVAPTLLSPAHREIITSTNMPLFDWEDNLEADLDGYVIQIDNNSDFSSPIINTTVTDSTYLSTKLLSNRAYFWRVRAVDAVGNRGPWSLRFKFWVNIP